MSTPPVSSAQFKIRFARDFVFGTTMDKVLDSDITNALSEAMLIFNSGLWEDEAEGAVAFGFAAAHCLVLNVQAAGGLSAQNLGRGVHSHGGGVVNNKSVGSVSVGYAVPDFVTSSAILSQLMRTDYGQRYLHLLTPRLVGNINVLEGSNDTGVGRAV
jgi:hypothetical protein